MKKFVTLILSLVFCLSLNAKDNVTKFLGIPVDGKKSEMVKKLKSKGFKLMRHEGEEMLIGVFNGHEVVIGIDTGKGKVSRIMVCDVNTQNESGIRARFNKLCQQFKNNGKYVSLEDYTIPDDEDIWYGMNVKKKAYQAVFYQLSDEESFENFRESLLQKYTPEQIESASDELKREIVSDCVSELFSGLQNRPVWFKISELYGKYYISMFYDNEYNRAQGEDL